MKVPKIVDLPPVWGALFFTLIVLWARSVSLAPLPSWTVDLGRALMLLGLAWIGWAAWYFFKHRTPIEPRHHPKVMIVEGPFKLVRHPIYRGLIWIVLGWALTEREGTGVLLALAYGWVLRRRFAVPEETVLAERFPEAFAAWRAQTPLQL
jgi:protein-S-isoprenylcysteine O-methyltransferase Ste14